MKLLSITVVLLVILFNIGFTKESFKKKPSTSTGWDNKFLTDTLMVFDSGFTDA